MNYRGYHIWRRGEYAAGEVYYWIDEHGTRHYGDEEIGQPFTKLCPVFDSIDAFRKANGTEDPSNWMPKRDRIDPATVECEASIYHCLVDFETGEIKDLSTTVVFGDQSARDKAVADLLSQRRN